MPDPVQTQFLTPEDGDLDGGFNSPAYDKTGVGLALSGGGYKAAAYHLGALIRLNELGWLKRVNRVSSVSGGSIAAGLLGVSWKNLTFDANGIASNFNIFVDPLQTFLTTVGIDVSRFLLGVLNPFSSAADEVAKVYDKHLYKKATLQDLPSDAEGPRFVLVATNYELNSLWRFARPYAADFNVGQIANPTFSIAKVVAASSAFPPFFCPMTLKFDGQAVVATAGAKQHAGVYLDRAILCDGGIYDNMGLEPIWKRYGTLLVSNAGNAFEEGEHPSDWGRLMYRIIGMMHRQAENNRQRLLMMLVNAGHRTVGYWPLRNDGGNYPGPPGPPMTKADIELAQGAEVRLRPLKANTFKALANHGYRLCDLAMRSYVTPASQPPAKLPF